MSGRFDGVPPGHAVDILEGREVLRSTEHAGSELHCSLARALASRSEG